MHQFKGWTIILDLINVSRFLCNWEEAAVALWASGEILHDISDVPIAWSTQGKQTEQILRNILPVVKQPKQMTKLIELISQSSK